MKARVKDQRVADTMTWLERRGTKKQRDALARYGIVARNALGVSVGDLRVRAKALGRDHTLAQALWDTECYEARMLAGFVDEPAKVTPTQMNAWAKDFDNWAICDHCCFHLFDKTPHAYKKVVQWSSRREEFVKRAAFALLASLALHDKRAADEPFVESLALIEREAVDERNFVKKGVSWALRGIGHRNAALRRQSLEVARRLTESEDVSARWIGRDAIRDLKRG